MDASWDFIESLLEVQIKIRMNLFFPMIFIKKSVFLNFIKNIRKLKKIDKNINC